MKKPIFFLGVMSILVHIVPLQAQQNLSAEVAPGVEMLPGSPANPEVLWDIHFDYNATSATSGDVGMAGAVYFNNEFWVSRWASDTIYRFNALGGLVSEFTIPGLSGVRALTTDGTYIYAGTNTTTIYRIQPGTQTLFPPHITSASPNPVRFCTYDPNLNGGSGGFYVGNFGTTIDAIHKTTGVVLSSIPAGTHGLTGMYGAAVDNFTPGGPYLWIFNQGGPSTSDLVQLQLPSGAPTGLVHDVFPDFSGSNGLTSSLAGGCFISDQIVPGEVTLGGIMQGTPNNVLFGYELDIPTIDVEVNDAFLMRGYKQIPEKHVAADSVQITYSNQSGVQIDSVILDITYLFQGSPVHTDQVVELNVVPGTNFVTYSPSYLPVNGVGNYVIRVQSGLGGILVDSDPSNDTLSYTFAVTDSVYARDNGIPDGGAGYGVSSTEWAYAVSNFQLEVQDTLEGIWIELATPVQGDTTFAVLMNTAGGIPGGLPVTGPIELIQSGQMVYYLPFSSGVPLAPGVYAFGCYEGVTGLINLAQSASVFTPGTNYFYTPQSGWVSSGIQSARFIHPVFRYTQPNTMGVDEQQSVAVQVFPNPTDGIFTVKMTDIQHADFQLYDINGRVLKSGKLMQETSQLDISSFTNGMYLLRIVSNGKIIGEQPILKN